MRAALLFMLLVCRGICFVAPMLPALALAQGTSNNCKFVSATCQAKNFIISAGGSLVPPSDLGASLGSASKRFLSVFAATFKDGNSVNRLIFSSAQGNVYVGAAPNGVSAISHLFNTTAAYSTAGAKLASFQNNTVEKLFIDKDGKIGGSFATPQLIDMSAGANGIRLSTGSTLGGDIYLSDLGGTTYAHASNSGLFIYSSESPAVITHAAQSGIGSGTNGVATEFGRAAAAGTGILAVTFATAFGTVPSCTCADENAVPVGCGISTAPSTTAVSFQVLAVRADTVDWFCIGVK